MTVRSSICWGISRDLRHLLRCHLRNCRSRRSWRWLGRPFRIFPIPTRFFWCWCSPRRLWWSLIGRCRSWLLRPSAATGLHCHWLRLCQQLRGILRIRLSWSTCRISFCFSRISAFECLRNISSSGVALWWGLWFRTGFIAVSHWTRSRTLGRLLFFPPGSHLDLSELDRGCSGNLSKFRGRFDRKWSL